jgi:hypothetical protein
MTHPLYGPFHLNEKGYPRLHRKPYRDVYLHRAVFETVAGRPVRDGFQIHHMNGKRCFCPHNLIELEACLHTDGRIRRDPYTGEALTPDQWKRRYI